MAGVVLCARLADTESCVLKSTCMMVDICGINPQ